jgi:cytochrome b6-f complex iron-sulfur subunit
MGFIKALLGKCDTRPLASDYWTIEGANVRVKLSQMPDPLPLGGAVYLEGGKLSEPLLLFRTQDDKYLAFVNRCTHGGRKIDPMPNKPLLRCCSLGHSIYDYDGNKITGPAKGPLVKYDVEQSAGDVIIKR